MSELPTLPTHEQPEAETGRPATKTTEDVPALTDYGSGVEVVAPGDSSVPQD